MLLLDDTHNHGFAAYESEMPRYGITTGPAFPSSFDSLDRVDMPGIPAANFAAITPADLIDRTKEPKTMRGLWRPMWIAAAVLCLAMLAGPSAAQDQPAKIPNETCLGCH